VPFNDVSCELFDNVYQSYLHLRLLLLPGNGTHLVTQRGHVKLFCLMFKITGMGKARRGLWCEKTMKLAVKAVLADGLSNVKASQRYNVPLETLRRKVLVARAGDGVEKKLGRRTVL